MTHDRENMDHKARMLAGLPYKPWLDGLLEESERARRLCYEYNHLPPERWGERVQLLKQLLGKTGQRLFIEPEFHCDYGTNITVGEDFYANFNLVILDPAPVTIGDHVMIAPNVSASPPSEMSLRMQSSKFCPSRKARMACGTVP